MAILRFTLVFILMLPALVRADIEHDDLPGNTIWYLHVDLKALRASDAGQSLNAWFEREVVKEINDELGIDISKEVDAVTAYADAGDSTVLIVDGDISSETQQTLLQHVEDDAFVKTLTHSGKDYLHILDDDPGVADNSRFVDLDDSAYISFALPGKAIVTGKEGHMQELLDSNGRITGDAGNADTIFLLSADSSFIQAGLRPGEMADGPDSGWESTIVQNTKQAALLITDKNGMVAVDARLTSTDPGMAQAMGGIVNGLIGLQALNSELGPEIQGLIRNTRVDVDGNILAINTVIDPALITTLLSE